MTIATQGSLLVSAIMIVSDVSREFSASPDRGVKKALEYAFSSVSFGVSMLLGSSGVDLSERDIEQVKSLAVGFMLGLGVKAIADNTNAVLPLQAGMVAQIAHSIFTDPTLSAPTQIVGVAAGFGSKMFFETFFG